MRPMISSQRTMPAAVLAALVIGHAAEPAGAAPQIEFGGPEGPMEEARAELYDELRLEPRETPVSRVAQAVTPSVVFVETEQVRPVRTFFGTARQIDRGSGSGVVIHKSGYIVTNYHVIEGARQIKVSFQDQPGSYSATLMSFVPEEDLALLKIDPGQRRIARSLGGERSYGAANGTPDEETFPTVRLGTSADLMPGERVVAIGSPHGQTYTVSTGIISGLHRDVPVQSRNLNFRGLIQTDASINLGNSGGPLLNIRGELIGINTVMNSVAENIGFAIPVDRVRQVLEDDLFPDARKAWLGFDVEARPEGLVVTRVWDEGPASGSGICQGDRILSLRGQPVGTDQDYLLQELNVVPGEEVVVGVDRDGDIEEAAVRSWDELDGYFYREVGMTVSEERFPSGRTYLMVDRIRPSSPASELGVEPRDLIPAIRPRIPRAQAYWLRDRASFKALLEQLPRGTEIEVDAYRDMNRDLSYDPNEQLKGVLIR